MATSKGVERPERLMAMDRLAMPKLNTSAEQRAEEAESLSAFSGFKLLHVKREISALLSLIGRHDIFDEYTVHDISHIDAMLESLEWLIPASAKDCLSSADWLIIVLAVYFHDLGMLVTKEEFDLRAESGFPEFCRNVLFSGQSGADYEARIRALGPGDDERFLYEEFVRKQHAERIKEWICGEAPPHLGQAKATVETISDLLSGLDKQFRRDLGMVCESHHLDDLADLTKYCVRRAYGKSDAEMCNLQYAAIILRSADLLHITSDRSPSILFKSINPRNPLSQLEWAKQMAVRRVGPSPSQDPPDTIEVHAFFSEPEPFFGLLSYLRYAEKELQRSAEWCRGANVEEGVGYEFPWCVIDVSHIETEGFLPKKFAYDLDQDRILDLLVGHTLYNNTGVVLRELVQNSLDAVRLRRLSQTLDGSDADPGEVRVYWDSTTRVLTVEDNGTGMSQEIIERHFLNVGSSRYQDAEFKRQFPTFSPISKFGIGILSTFMVSDEVEILTVHEADDAARQLLVQSVHEGYLIRLISKADPIVRNAIGDHGTRVIVKLRPSAQIDDVVGLAQRWIVLPGEGVTVRVWVDAADPVDVGYQTLAEALDSGMRSAARSPARRDVYEETEREQKTDIRTQVNGCVHLAYGLRWSERFRTWSFVSGQSDTSGVCIEGIRVTFASPGFGGQSLAALANLTGEDSPSSNVARDGLEPSDEYAAALRVMVGIYIDHIEAQFRDLQANREGSVAGAAKEAQHLAHAVVSGRIRFNDVGVFEDGIRREALNGLPIVLADRRGVTECLSLSALGDERDLWTIDCPTLRSAERIAAQLPGATSLSRILSEASSGRFIVPESTFLWGSMKDYFEMAAIESREVDRLVVDRDSHRVDLRWIDISDPPAWLRWNPHGSRAFFSGHGELYMPQDDLWIPLREVEMIGTGSDVAIRAFGMHFMVPNAPFVSYLRECALAYLLHESEEQRARLDRASDVARACMRSGTSLLEDDDWHRYRDYEWSPKELERVRKEAAVTNWVVFDPHAWTRR